MNNLLPEEELIKNLIILDLETIQKMFSYENGGDLVALYLFYHKQCKLQKTNQSRSNESFVKTGLGWGTLRFRNAKHKLKELGFIEDISERDEKWHASGWYVKLNYIRSLNKDTLSTPPQNQVVDNWSSTSNQIQLVDNPTSWFQETNAWSNISINALSSEKGNAWKKSRVKKINPNEAIVIPSKDEIILFMWDSLGVRKIAEIIGLENMKQSMTVQDVENLYSWTVDFFMEKYPKAIYMEKEWTLVGASIILGELDKFIGYCMSNPDKEIKSIKGRLITWITNSAKYNQA